MLKKQFYLHVESIFWLINRFEFVFFFFSEVIAIDDPSDQNNENERDRKLQNKLPYVFLWVAVFAVIFVSYRLLIGVHRRYDWAATKPFFFFFIIIICTMV